MVLLTRKRVHFAVRLGFVVCIVFQLSLLVTTHRGIDSVKTNLPSFDFEPPSLQQQEHNVQVKQAKTNCTRLPYQPLEKVETFRNYLFYRDRTQLSTVTGDFDSPLAICRLDMRAEAGWMVHFPHVMQHLYTCYSFWMDNPSKLPVMLPVGKSKWTVARRHSQNPFLKGFVEILESELGVQIFDQTELDEWLLKHNFTIPVQENASVKGENRLVPVHPKMVEFARPLGYVFSHASKLNKMVISHYGMKHEQIIDKHERSKTHLKIGFLNRMETSGRSILNAKELVQFIESDIPKTMNASEDSWLRFPPFAQVSSTVALEYFEGKNTLQEQIQFFNSIDILVSPHGAQLTGLPFMANKKCTQLIEFFPDRYFMPDFYGSLAIDSGIGYSHVYFSPETVEEQSRKYSTAVFQRIVAPPIPVRTKHRAQNLCVDTFLVIEAIQQAIHDWAKCQQEQQELHQK